MELEIKKLTKKLNATIKAPSSKSYTNRALIIAALAKGKSILKNVSLSEDSLYMIKALKQFGIEIFKNKGDLVVKGSAGIIKIPKEKIYIGNAGTAMRFLVGFSALADGKVLIDGSKRMRERPIQDLLEALNSLGVKAYSKYGNNCPPVIIEGGNFIGGKCKLKANISSQFLSSILMVAPYAKKNVKIKLIGELTSKPYVDMTLDVIKKFGGEVENDSYKNFKIKKGCYKARTYTVEGDFSNASYFFAAAAITCGKMKVIGLNPNSAQGDKRFIDLLKKMGCKIKTGKNWIQVEGNKLKGIDVYMNDMLDVVPTLVVIAPFAKGKTTIRNIANLRFKESDRIAAIATELRKLGANVKEGKDSLLIIPGKLKGVKIETYNDHRIAMAFSISGLAIDGIIIKNPECVKKSFPEFFKVVKKIGG